jgi:hypothetical protein
MTVVGSYFVTNTPNTLALGDLDRDGGLDVVTVGSGGSFVSVNLHGSLNVTAVDAPAPELPRVGLRQNYPNPFNPSTTIRFSLRDPDHARLQVYDVRGRLVATLADGLRAPGEHYVRWDGQDRQGTAVASGIYFYRLETRSGFTESKRMVLVK